MIDDLDWIATTVWGEARGESFEGKVAVAAVICNRMHQTNATACEVVLKPWQFSFWNTDDPSRWRMRPTLTDSGWKDSYKAASAIYYGLIDDPTRGCLSYLNPTTCTVEQKRRAGYVYANVRAVVGRHHFFIAV